MLQDTFYRAVCLLNELQCPLKLRTGQGKMLQTMICLIRGADNPTTFFVTQEDPVQVALVQLQNSAKIRGSAAFVLIDLVQYPGFCDTAA